MTVLHNEGDTKIITGVDLNIKDEIEEMIQMRIQLQRIDVWQRIRLLWSDPRETTFGGRVWWNVCRQNEIFELDEHATGIWLYNYRILLKAGRVEIAKGSEIDKLILAFDFLDSITKKLTAYNINTQETLTEFFKRLKFAANSKAMDDPDAIVNTILNDMKK